MDLEQLVQASEERIPPEVLAVVRAKQAPADGGAGSPFVIIGENDDAAPSQPLQETTAAGVVDSSMLRRLENLGFGGAKPSATELERLLGSNDLVDEFYLQRALVAAQPILRIVLRDAAGRERGWATGFLVSPGLLLTNHHVFPSLEETEHALAEANYVLDIAGNPAASYRFAVRGDRFYYAVPELDFALAAVEPASQDGQTQLSAFGYHRLNPQPNKICENECMTIIQHPGGDRRQLAIRENRLVKITDSYLWYRSDTAQGSSGAPAFNDSFQVVALHHSGAAQRDENGLYVLKDGRKVNSLRGIAESEVVWVANEGVRISAVCAHLLNAADLNREDPLVQELFRAMQGGDVISNALKGRVDVLPAAGASPQPGQGAQQPGVTVSLAPGGGGVSIPLQLNIQVTVAAPGLAALGQAGAGQAAGVGLAESAFEALSRIKVDRDYSGRQGYQTDFLGIPAPLPIVTDPALVSHLDDGSYVLPYEHFSVVLNKKRRMPLFTAINIDYTERMRYPEAGKYGRKELTGSENEVWLTDPRIPQQDQLPDRFYDQDGGYFDKGHIVRREDACWGESYAQVVRGNCDTFHVTNCTPQVAGFNRSQLGVNDWGDLEDEIQKQAKAERLCVFAGPILSRQDRVFTGRDDYGPVRIQIPSEYWKVVLANERGKLMAFAFILKQDLTTVPEEFAVNATWRPYQLPLASLEERLEGFCFPPEVHRADTLRRNKRRKTARAS